MISNCTRCHLCNYRSHIVEGRGNPFSARILLLGEAPGLSEDVLGKAFIGESGKLLDDMLKQASINVDTCFFTNTVLCRPCNGRSDHVIRPPAKEEVLACLPNVTKIIESIKHIEIVVFVGRVAESFYRIRLQGFTSMYLTHPSHILKNGGKGSSSHAEALNALRKGLALMAGASAEPCLGTGQGVPGLLTRVSSKGCLTL